MGPEGVNTYHSRHAPDVRTSTPFGAKDHFRRPVLASLDVVGEMMAHPTSVPQIRNLDRYGVHCRVNLFLALVLGGPGFVQRDAGDILGQDVTSPR